MSGFLLRTLPAYVPGEHEEGLMMLNSNESPFPPSPGVLRAVTAEVPRLSYYNDPDCKALCAQLALRCGVSPEMVMPGNGSDEVLYFAFMAFADATHPIALPDITYSYYALFAAALGIPLHRIPLRADLSVCPEDYVGLDEMIVLTNPQAPTGYALSVKQIERIAQGNPERIVLVDEAYVDFGAQSCQSLLCSCENLLVVRTFSKSHSLAGARLGYALGCPARIAELSAVRNAVNLYSVNRMTQAAGIAACQEEEYYRANCERIKTARTLLTEGLRALGFKVLPSLANFVFARCPRMDAGRIQQALRTRGILVRHWDTPRIDQYLRITVGTMGQMHTLLGFLSEILESEEAGQCEKG